jgi:type IV pilus assembly protein PilM
MATTSKTAKPRLACEISAERVIAARADESRSLLEVCAARSLELGSVVPNLTNPNLLASEALARAVAESLGEVAGRGRDVTVVLPDAAVRVLLLDFEELPDNANDAEGVVRFRLKKSLPFDAEKAALSYQSARTSAGVRVIAAVAQPSVVEEYESVFREAGYSPGIVLPSMLAALGAVDASLPTLVLKVDAATTSVAVVNNEELLLFRTVENSTGGADLEQVADEVYPSLVFFQDTYGLKVERILLGGTAADPQIAPALKEQTGARVEDLVRASVLPARFDGNTPRAALAGVVGALIS